MTDYSHIFEQLFNLNEEMRARLESHFVTFSICPDALTVSAHYSINSQDAFYIDHEISRVKIGMMSVQAVLNESVEKIKSKRQKIREYQ